MKEMRKARQEGSEGMWVAGGHTEKVGGGAGEGVGSAALWGWGAPGSSHWQGKGPGVDTCLLHFASHGQILMSEVVHGTVAGEEERTLRGRRGATHRGLGRDLPGSNQIVRRCYHYL